uniref:Complex I assembly factor TIMMDC1, mitochondrial n=1 Tax=Syphacia muris TaxID=451379 RepID=A0A0N5AT08_9BILA
MTDVNSDEGHGLKRFFSFGKRLLYKELGKIFSFLSVLLYNGLGVSETDSLHHSDSSKVLCTENTKLNDTVSNDAPRIEPKNGFQRIIALYRDGEVHGERIATAFITKGAFIVGGFFGGILSAKKNAERYSMHSEGKKFLSPRDILLRRGDYAIITFVRHGLRAGLKSAAIVGSIAHLTVWRNHFSAWYFPLFSVPIFAIFSLPYGSYAFIEGATFGLSTGLTLTAGTYLVACAKHKSVNETYNILKAEYEEKERKKRAWRSQIRSVMKEENLHFPGDAIKIINDRKAAELLNLNDPDGEEDVELSDSKK